MEQSIQPTLVLRETSSGAPATSPGGGRRVPSPLRHAQFRPLAMEYVVESEGSPKSCKYYPEPLEGVVAGEIVNPGGYCAAVRTVG